MLTKEIADYVKKKIRDECNTRENNTNEQIEILKHEIEMLKVEIKILKEGENI